MRSRLGHHSVVLIVAIILGSRCQGQTLPAYSPNTSEPVSAVNDARSGTENAVPSWAADAVFYQIFPERFRNGDSTNDPTRTSLEGFERLPDSWVVTPWTSDWYHRSDWERALDPKNFYATVNQRRYGGDLQGVIDKLDYLTKLGINAIYFNPLFHARSAHKYDATSLHHIDPYFGPDPEGDLQLIRNESDNPQTWQWTAADKLFLTLVHEMHNRGMKVVIDGVFNHTGREFFAFADLRKNQQESKFRDWYLVRRYDDPTTAADELDYQAWWNYKSLPEFADNLAGDDLATGPKQYIADITRRWMDPNQDGDPTDGVDGWRLDVATDVPLGFWASWNQLVRSLNPAAYTVGEFWEQASQQVSAGGFSATMNYHGFALPIKGFLVDGKLSAVEFGNLLVERLQDHPPTRQVALQNLVDSHDTQRVASMIVNSEAAQQGYIQSARYDYDLGPKVSPRTNPDYLVRSPNDRERAIQRLIVLLQTSFVGSPMIYYGSEAGMWGADDPCDRQPMVWDDLRYDPQASDPRGRNRPPESIAFDSKLFDFYRQMIRLRSNHAVLRRGKFEVVAADEAVPFVVFSRTDGNSQLLIAFNRSDSPYRWISQIQGGKPFEILATTGNSPPPRAEQSAGFTTLTIPPLTGLVVCVSSPKSSNSSQKLR